MACTGLRLADGVHNHTPNEVTSFSMTFANLLGDGESVSSVSSTTVLDEGSPGLTVDSTQVSTPLVVVTVSGGVANENYFVVVKVLTNLGQTLEGAVQVYVDDAVET